MMRDSMKDQGWAAVVTALGQEHLAHNECRRFCLTCYLPQRRIRVWPKGATEPVLWAVPLIRGRLLLPLAEARDRALHYARGVRGPEYLVKGPKGRPWTAPDEAVRELSTFEREGAFDDPLPHNALRGSELMAAIAGEALAQLFAPLFFRLCAPCVPRAH
jgi:hypothetical protein